MNLDLGDGGVDPRRTAHKHVRDALRRAILRGTLPGGTRLVQVDIAKQLEVSTTPVREALRDLATEGLIKLDAHRGATVHNLQYDEVQEIYDIRLILEPEAMRRVVRTVKPETLREARRLQDRMNTESDVGAWTDLNRDFHGLLVGDIDSPRLLAILQGLRDAAAPYVGLLLTSDDSHMADRGGANEDHRQLLDALDRSDEDQVAAVTAQHLRHTIEALSEAQAALQRKLHGANDGEASDGVGGA